MKRAKLVLLLLVALALIAAACTSDSDDTTTTTAASTETTAASTETTAASTETTAAPTETTAAPTETTAAAPMSDVTLKFWTTETEPSRLEKTEANIANFTSQTGIGVELTAVEEDLLPQLMITNAASGTLPDVVFHPLDFTVGWASAGILNQDAAAEVLESLGTETFAEGSLRLGTFDGKPTAVPSDGWGQMLIYRKDLFDAAGLEKPDTFEKIAAAAEALNTGDVFGITASNDPAAVFTQQTWEQFALANGCELVDDAGTVTLNTSNCSEAIGFYAELLNDYSPAGLQDVVTTRATYFAGQAAMLVWSPFILDEMAGLRDAALPTCPECADDPAFLAKNSDFVPAFAGPNGSPAQYGQASYMGIGMTENTEEAKQFVEYWLNEGYIPWLAVAPEGKFPMRRGTQEEPTKFLEEWSQLEVGVDRKAPLSDFYSAEVVDGLIAGTNSFSRWGFIQGQGDLVTVVYSTLIVPQTLDEVLAGGLSPEEGAAEMQLLVEDEQALLAEEAEG